ncbi:MAG TPA: 16S rRNA (guanine(966)-N(2))-methyltransferase RsmD [Candidatus Kapabacteria bacterium]|nr:16S rRNA (guanine(966)-N(2))-methyltransferase RsmD [Candidatus Kapabacteria bacterium]
MRKSTKPAGKAGAGPKGPGEVRIIGGQWRGRRLQFSAHEGLRPTLDRYRETLFNWLMFDVEGARCLDLFAGSGALGFEALSRGAREVDFVDANPRVCSDIRANLGKLGSEKGRVWHSAAEAWLKARRNDLASGTIAPYDLVFLDPPFHQDLLQACIHLLETGGWLAENARIYLEAENSFDRSKLPYHWRVHKEKDGGNKIFLLLIRQPDHPLAPA